MSLFATTTWIRAELFFVAALLLSYASAYRSPNIIFVLTDDQDVTAGSLDYMAHLNDIFRRDGMEFRNFYVPTGLCCPSRATILRGQYCHNHKIYDNGDLTNATYQSGNLPKFVDTGLEKETVATLLHTAGYETALIGKYLNGYSDKEASHVPPGWTHWMGMTDHSYYGPHFSQNGKLLKTDPETYQTDFIRDWVYGFVTEERDDTKPFFLYVSPFAPHTPAKPARRHQYLFQDLRAPRFPSYNSNDGIQQMKPSWIKALPPLTTKQQDDIDEFYRNRLRSLQAVDEFLLNLTETLQIHGLDKKTYIFYMGDNGQHFGDFRLPAGKRQAYETDILVPFLVRGPGISAGKNVSEVVQSVDLGMTWLELAGADAPSYPMDGKSILPLLRGLHPSVPKTNQFRAVALAEMYGGSSNIGIRYKGMPGYYGNHFYNNTYQAVRVINGSAWAADANWLYVEWCTGEAEFYNLTDDPHEINNLIHKVDFDILRRLSVLVSQLGSCIGKECYEIDWQDIVSQARQLSRQFMEDSARSRLPCFNPPNMSWPNSNLRRRPFAVDSFVPEPFLSGFPFSDGEIVSEDHLRVWEKYKQYFY